MKTIDFATASTELVEPYVDRVGWNPGDQPGEWSLLILTPVTVLAWNSVTETEGRTIMRRGAWAA